MVTLKLNHFLSLFYAHKLNFVVTKLAIPSPNAVTSFGCDPCNKINNLIFLGTSRNFDVEDIMIGTKGLMESRDLVSGECRCTERFFKGKKFAA